MIQNLYQIKPNQTSFHMKKVSYHLHEYIYRYKPRKMSLLDCTVLARFRPKENSSNYWEQLTVNLTLKFLWNAPSHVSFQTALVSLNLELCRVSYTLLNPCYPGGNSDFQVKLQKFITKSILTQCPYNLYLWKPLDVQFHIKMNSFRFDGQISVRTRQMYGCRGVFTQQLLDSF